MFIITKLSQLSGVSEPAVRLLVSVLIAYPITIVYRLFLHHNSNVTKTHSNLLFAICGFAVCYFNYGLQVFHSLLAVVLTFILITKLYKSKFLVPISFSFHMGYLLMGYYTTSTENYDICWTMCHCVLVLRLIGLTFDVVDSITKPETLGLQDPARTNKIPTFLEMMAFSYFPPTVLIGPQFTFKRYYDFIDKKYEGKHCLHYGLKRGLVGLFYLGIYQLGLIIVPDSYYFTPEFGDRNLLYKLIYVGIWGRCTLYKYISCWIISEGAATCSGLTFVSRDEKTGEEDWSGCANIKLMIFENVKSFGNYVASFNVQTNLWTFKYVYKRLIFLGNRNISHVAALAFLAIWHGFHSGYYMTFFFEFLLVHFEKQMTPRFEGNPKFMKFISTPFMRVVIFLLLKFYALTFAGYCLIPFAFLSFSRWWSVYRKLYFIGHIAILPMSLVYKPLLCKLLKIVFPLDKETVVEPASVKAAVSESIKSTDQATVASDVASKLHEKSN